MAAIFPNAQQTHISGGSFTVVQGNIHQGVKRSGLDLLCDQCALGALLDSDERYDPPNCAEQTRIAIMEELVEWIVMSSNDSASMMWLYGGAGAGKSAIGQTLAKLCQGKGRLAASFFFSRTSAVSDRSDGNRLVPSLVYQVMQVVPKMRKLVERVILEDPAIFSMSRRTQMERLFIQPLIAIYGRREPEVNFSGQKKRNSSSLFKGLLKETTRKLGLDKVWRPRLIVIDGLDECQDPDVQIDLLQIIASAIPQLPLPFRFLIASRPESYLTQVFDLDYAFLDIKPRRINLSMDSHADDDIRQFLVKGFKEIHRTHLLRAHLDPAWPTEEAITTLVRKSSSHFIYASTVMKYIQHSRARPDQRLEVILSLEVSSSHDKPYSELDTLYMHIFLTIKQLAREIINRIFGILNIATTTDHVETSPAILEEYLELRAGELTLILDPLLSLVELPADRSQPVKILHASLFDFLEDDSRSGIFRLNVSLGHESLTKYYFKVMEHSTHAQDIQTTATFNDIHLQHCWHLFYHRYRCFPETNFRSQGVLKDELASFNFLYDVILHPVVFPISLASRSPKTSDGAGNIPNILQNFFVSLMESAFSGHLYAQHTQKVEEQLQIILKTMNPQLPDISTPVPRLFEDDIYQSRHQVYKVLIDIMLCVLGTDISTQILGARRNFLGPGETANDVRKHFLVILVPDLTKADIEGCTRHSVGLNGNRTIELTNPSELDRLVLRRVVEYLKRVEADADPTEIARCRAAWRIPDQVWAGNPTLDRQAR